MTLGIYHGIILHWFRHHHQSTFDMNLIRFFIFSFLKIYHFKARTAKQRMDSTNKIGSNVPTAAVVADTVNNPFTQ